jgi:lipoate-protein ligase A
MIYIDFNNYLRASYSFAVEEYIMQNHQQFPDEYFLFWTTTPTLMLGRYQNTLDEINQDYVAEHNIDVVRRNSGGGTIYTDNSCWQYTFITWREQGKVKEFRDFTAPVVAALRQLGVNAEFSGRNDLMLENKKFSGTAQYSMGDRFLHHGAILFDTDLHSLTAALKVNNDKLQRKGVASISDYVTNIKPYLSEQMNSTEFKNAMLDLLGNSMKRITLSDNALVAIAQIEQSKFRTKQWNYGQSPGYNISNKQQFGGGKVEAKLLVIDDIIRECVLYGDFFLDGDITEIERALVGVKYDYANVYACLRGIPSANSIYRIPLDALINCIV